MFFAPQFVKDAQELQRLVNKIYFYRRAVLPEADRGALLGLSNRFKSAIKTKNRALIDTLTAEADKLLKRVGGHYHKHYHLFENVETFVVAAILAIGIRSFFLQPFKIPTNSMWPTYHGMTYTVRECSTPAPNALQSTAGLIFQGNTQHILKAPIDGRLTVAVFSRDEREINHAAFRYATVNKPILGLIPNQVHEYLFYVGETPITLDVPVEFSLDKLLVDKFFKNGATLSVDSQGRADTGIDARAGDILLNFQIETGDMLFVDRFSYNFISPKVGDPIVFRTREVPGLTRLNGGMPDDKYYIKRLVGTPGDQLSILGSTLYRNGTPITGSPIFAKNFKKVPPYSGYEARYDLENGQRVTVPAKSFYAFGDNSPESLDSRVWGAMPQDQLVGRAVFIYYPFTDRWGFSK